MTPRFNIGDAVIVPEDYCPGCGSRVGLLSGLVTGRETQPSALFGDDPGPFYTVLVDHKHNGTGHLVYSERELLAPTEVSP